MIDWINILCNGNGPTFPMLFKITRKKAMSMLALNERSRTPRKLRGGPSRLTRCPGGCAVNRWTLRGTSIVKKYNFFVFVVFILSEKHLMWLDLSIKSLLALSVFTNAASQSLKWTSGAWVMINFVVFLKTSLFRYNWALGVS